MKVFWTTKALNRLRRVRQLHDYLGKGGETGGKNVVERLTRLAAGIPENLEGGRPLPYFEGEEIQEVIDGTFRLVYRVLPDAIHVLTVRHTPLLMPTRFLLEP